ncbi:hypothetical protein [Actibacterium lipolyticum]|uniref:Uncharacterized protein n=1 Tax=Actibacterium lipolyticum TaxID=1524263 RepID=A0A238JN65_9RHOB|nr:hypothetical protein [Actibacterium lipolyticum]SMX31216.1 hypothetical protein COL8621_00336 [Actibacterium lipolyticum]
MLRPAARAVLTLVMIVSLACTALTAFQLANNPAVRIFVDRTADEIARASDQAMARAATPARIEQRLFTLLSETPRNWLAIDAVAQVAADRGIAPSATLVAQLDQARTDDTGLITQAQKCGRCMIDAAHCEFSAVLLCQAPVALTPIGDIAGVATEGAHFVAGEPVDQVNLTLSLIGLAAVGLVVITGGSSASIKIGASSLKLARKMNVISPRLGRMINDAATRGVDWQAVPSARSIDDLSATLRPDVIGPLADTAQNIGRMRGALGGTATLHMLRYVDDAAEAKQIAKVSEVLGARTVGRMEVLGKSRLLRTTIRFSRTAWVLAASVLALFLAALSLLGSFIWARLSRRIARAI